MRIVGALALGCITASPAWAQRATGPFAGLFGGDRDNDRAPEVRQSLALRAGLFGGFDDNRVDQDPNAPSIPDARLFNSGFSVGASGNLSYSRRSDSMQLQLNGGSAVRRYNTNSNPVVSYLADGALTANPNGRLVLNATGGFSYSPFYQFEPTAGISDDPGLTPGFGYAVVPERNVSTSGGIALTGNLTRRASIEASATMREWLFLDRRSSDVGVWGARAGFRHQFTRALALRLGYERHDGDYGRDAARALNETIDAGVEYRDTLAIARRTAFAFGTSTAAVHYQNRTGFRLNGHATLTRGFGRTWSAAAKYSRGTDFVAGFREPLFADSVNGSVGGLIGRRLHLSSNAEYSRGTIGFLDGHEFQRLSGSSRVTVAVTRLLGLYGQQTYYHHRVAAGTADVSLDPRFSRNAFSAGISLWIPIINDTRPIRDSR